MPVTIKPATLRYKDENGVYKTADCLKGDPGGIPAGGTAGQYLKKVSGTDYDAGWVTLIADNLTTDDATKALSAKQGYTLNNQIGATYYTSVTVTATGNTALKRIHNQWSNIISAIKTAHGLTADTGMVNITGRAEFPANGTASNLGTYFYWGDLNCSNGYGTMYVYQYHNSPLYIYRNHGTTADGSTVGETAADIT